jgi:sugar phosphate isomerase/epimerase
MNNPHRSLEREIEYILSLGFDGVELTAEPPCSDISQVRNVSRELLRHCLVGHTRGDLFFAACDKEARRSAVELFNRYLDLFRELGITLVNIHPHVPHGAEIAGDVRARNIECFASVVEYARALGSEVMIENQPPFNSSADFQWVFSQIPEATILLDVAHASYVVGHSEPLSFLQIHLERIRHIHLSDNDGFDDDHFFIGHGKMDLRRYAPLFQAIAHRSVCLSLEAFRVRNSSGIVQIVTQEERGALTTQSLVQMRNLVN